MQNILDPYIAETTNKLTRQDLDVSSSYSTINYLVIDCYKNPSLGSLSQRPLHKSPVGSEISHD